MGLSLRELAAEVGMRAPSLYTHFDGKDAIYDAMFAQGWTQLHGELREIELGSSPKPYDVLVRTTEAFIDFCTANVPRYQLMFTHVLGEWQPSITSYEASKRAYDVMVEHLAQAGVTEKSAVDLWTAVAAGLMAQQLANDRGGDRWRQLVPAAVQMFLTHMRSAP
jgi:AcrR family transcriptional regulator